MIKLALVGKNISHSQSPKVYSDLLGYKVDYTLLDFQRSEEIPLAKKLFETFTGVSITAPYKEHFLTQVELVGEAQALSAINCLRNNNGKIEACNTDYDAIVEILKREKVKISKVVVLGDGVMARVAMHAIKKESIPVLQFSRKLNKDFASLDLTKLINQEKILVINTCARDYSYAGNISSDIIFWDFNYNFEPHRSNFQNKCEYMDGMEMLILQAKYALEFWSNKKKL